MRNLLKTLASRIKEGKDTVLVTIIASSGSTPRGIGSKMLVAEEGRIYGTIGGGAVEHKSREMAQALLQDRNSCEHDFRLKKEDVENLGMICGGAVKVFFKYVPASDSETLAICEKAEELFAKGDDLWLIYDIADDCRLGLYTKATGYIGVDAPAWLDEKLTRHPLRQLLDGRDMYVEQINSSGIVYVFGGGHVAQELVPVLTHIGFRCVVLDDRENFIREDLFPDAEKRILCDFENIAQSVNITSEDYCCVMTRGHSFDTVVQAQLLRTPAYYIGVVGSRSKKVAVNRKLVNDYGIDESEIARIITPIGLMIKAETPAEIAISIAGQLIEIRAERNKS